MEEKVRWATLTLRLKEEEKEILKELARREDLPLTFYAKRLLREEIKRFLREKETPGFMVLSQEGKGGNDGKRA